MAAKPTKALNRTTGAKPTLDAVALSDTYDVGAGMFAVIAVGATATTVTVVDPRITEYGAAFPDITIGPLTSTEVWIPLPSYLADGTGRATINVSQITAVTSAGVNATI